MSERTLWLQQFLTEQDDYKPERSGPALPKHEKMASNPFLFFRGSAPLYYHDLKENVIKLPESINDLPLTHVMGDCHISNFGFLTEEGSHGDDIVFTLNDFDDACVGNGIWDLHRFITSIFLCGDLAQSLAKDDREDNRYFAKKNVTEGTLITASRSFLRAYLRVFEQQVAGESDYHETIDYFSPDEFLHKYWQKAQSRAAGGELFEQKSTIAKAVDTEATPLKFAQNPEKFVHLTRQDKSQLINEFSPYMDDSVLDVVRRINSGTGSNHLIRYYFLVGPEGATLANLSRCHIIEVKQQRPAAALAYFPDLSPVNRLNPAHLTLACQRRMQRLTDLVLDAVEWRGRHFLVRSRYHAKLGVKPEALVLGKKAIEHQAMVQYAEHCGAALAMAHGRSDRRSCDYQEAMLEYLPKHGEALIESCMDYREQVKQDCASLVELIGA